METGKTEHFVQGRMVTPFLLHLLSVRVCHRAFFLARQDVLPSAEGDLENAGQCLRGRADAGQRRVAGSLFGNG